MTSVEVREHGSTPDGRPVRAYVLRGGAGGVQATVLDLGATVVSVRLPAAGDASGGGAGSSAEDAAEEITVGTADIGVLADRARNPYFGATVGRYANRIAGGTYVDPAVDGAGVPCATVGTRRHLAITFRGQALRLTIRRANGGPCGY